MSLTDRKSFLKILIITCFAIVTISAAPQKILIDSVSLSPHQFIPAHGLENGGTVLYVSGSGFNAYGKGISVYFGLYQCNVIPQESTSTMVACKMASMLKNKERQHLPITVYMVNSLPTSCYKSKCLFSFLESLTTGVPSEQARILNEGSPILKATCTAANQYADAGGICQPCDDKANSPGTATSNRQACVCNSTYTWSSTLQECVCPTNFIQVNGACLSCAPVKTRNGTGKASGQACECNTALFTFNVALFKCICTDIDSFVNAAGQCFPCSDKLEKGTGKVNGTYKACACQPTFVWDAKLNDCFCPTGTIFDETAKLCFSCSKLKGKNGTGLALSTNICQCNPTYVFVPQNNTCVCPDPESYVDKTSGACFSCSNIGNSTNTANAAARTCICTNNYIWNPTKSKTACLCPDNSFVITDTDTCFLCSKLKGKNSTGLASKVNNFSCECFKSFVFNVDTFVCQCPDEKSYIDKTTGQCVSCTGITNVAESGDIVNIPGRKCICKDNTYIWTPTLKIPACICPSNSVLLTNGSCFICGTLKGKNGTGLVNTTDSCGCLKSFVFNSDNGTCECPDLNSVVDKILGCISCSNVKNSLQTANFTTKQCNCLPTFVWSPSTNTTACNCPPNSFIISDSGSCFTCTKLKGKNGTGLVSSDGASCQCLKTYSFNKDTGVCECTDPQSYVDKTKNICIACKPLGNTTGEVNITQNVCICQDGFVFTPSINKLSCICPVNNFHVFVQGKQNRCVNCNTLKGNNSKGFVNKTTGKSCQCDKSFVYDAGLHACVCPFAKSYIDKVTKLCIACTGANSTDAIIVGNGTGQVDKSGNKCECSPTFIWTPTLKVPACICPANSIIIGGICFLCASNKTNYFTGFILNSTTCGCKKSFVFNPTTLQCQCPDAATSYIDKSTNLCVSCVASNNRSGEVDAVNKKCKCLDDTYVWVPTLKPPACLCLPNSILFRNESAGNDWDSCFSCGTLKGALKGTGGVSATNKSQCACIKTFVFDPVNLICICPPLLNSYINATSNTCISCNNIGNGTGQIVESGQGCVCNDTFVWDPTKSLTACLCPPLAILVANNTCFLCSSLSLPSATGKVSKTNNKQCECARTYVFNPVTLVCQCPTNSFVSSTTKLCVICTGVTANGPGTVNDVLDGCNCDENFSYTASLNRCQCKSPAKLVSGQCILPTSSTSLSASCPNDMVWDNTAGLCVCASGFAENNSNCIDCSTIQNSTEQTGSDRTSCKCKTGYNWSASQFACISS